MVVTAVVVSVVVTTVVSPARRWREQRPARPPPAGRRVQ